MPRNTQFTGKQKSKKKQQQKKANIERYKMSLAEHAKGQGGKLLNFLGSLFNPKKPAVAKRPCTACGRNHRHNNAFCSAHCCNEFKANFVAIGGHNVLRVR